MLLQTTDVYSIIVILVSLPAVFFALFSDKLNLQLVTAALLFYESDCVIEVLFTVLK